LKRFFEEIYDRVIIENNELNLKRIVSVPFENNSTDDALKRKFSAKENLRI
jgi:hypothetical protein